MEITIAGNPTIDLIITNSGVVKRYGGSIFYASLVLSALGARVKAVGIASADVVNDISKAFRDIGIEPVLEPADATTTFELDYRTKPRSVRLIAKPSRRIEAVTGDIVILAPVYDELSGAKIVGNKIVADLQGYLRSKSPLPEADLVHFSLDDLQITPEELLEFGKRWPSVVYTLGDEGAYILHAGVMYYINSARLNVVDATGSGDVFLAALTYFHYVKKLEIVDAACEASKIVAGFLATRRVVRYDFPCTKQVVQV